MKTKELKDLRKKPITELQKAMREKRAQLEDLRFDLAMGKVKNIKQINELRSSIAQILTIIKEKEHETT